MHGYCNMCGKCCEAIRLNMSPDEMSYGNSKDLFFVRRHWHPIAEPDAFAINPVLRLQAEAAIVPSPRYYYTCDMYDKATKRCMAHDERPDVCSRYPWYDNDEGAPDSEFMSWYSPTCDYINAKDSVYERGLLIELALELEKVTS